VASPRVFVDDLYPHETARRWETLCRRRIAESGAFRVAFAGGSTPRTLYEALATGELRREEWACVLAFLGDERPVAPEHPDSNWGMLRRSLLDPVALQEASRFRPEGEAADLDQAARAYEEALLAGLPLDATGAPVFDLMLLGLGPDGHTASLFPDSPALRAVDRWFVASPVRSLGTTRLTVTYPTLRAAREVWVLVTGAAKSAILAQVLGENGSDLPAGRLARWPNVRWIVDREVMDGLPANCLRRDAVGWPADGARAE
jgi:6-phosphogluconolactonase